MMRSFRRRAFSLVELMVSMVVLAILALIIAQVINLITSSTEVSEHTVDAASQARLVFDRIGLDLEAMVRRGDSDFRLDGTGTDTPLLSFLSEVTAPAPTGAGDDFENRGISLVSYGVDPHPSNGNRRCLVRAAKAIDWNEPGVFGIGDDGYPVDLLDAAYPVRIENEDAEVMSPAVIHAVIGVQLYPDNETVDLDGGSSGTRAQGQVIYQSPLREDLPLGGAVEIPNEQRVDVNRIASIVVGLVVIDLDSLEKLDANDLNTLAAAFDQLPDDGELPTDAWLRRTDNLRDLPDSIPLSVRQTVRVYERFYPITPYGTQEVR